MVHLVGALGLAVGCGDGSPGATLDELYDQGLTRYVGVFPPDDVVPLDDRVTRYEFDVPDDPSMEPRGPLCLRGTEFSVETREGATDELFIWLQEGGAWITEAVARSDDWLDTVDPSLR